MELVPSTVRESSAAAGISSIGRCAPLPRPGAERLGPGVGENVEKAQIELACSGAPVAFPEPEFGTRRVRALYPLSVASCPQSDNRQRAGDS